VILNLRVLPSLLVIQVHPAHLARPVLHGLAAGLSLNQRQRLNPSLNPNLILNLTQSLNPSPNPSPNPSLNGVPVLNIRINRVVL
jgi:hypothetical protein